MNVELTATITGDPDATWRQWKPSYPIRPRDEESRNRDLYPLAFGMKIPVTLVEVDEVKSWTVEHHLPAGRLVIRHSLTPLGEGQVELTKRLDVRGPMHLVYRLLMPGIQQSWRREIAVLERAAANP